MKKRSRNTKKATKKTTKKFKVPANLRDAAKAFVQLTRDQGTIELGSGVRLTPDQISTECKCQCSIDGLFTTGPAMLSVNQTGEYTYEVGTIGTNSVCTDCVHMDTTFLVNGMATLTKMDKTKVSVTIKGTALKGQKITLTAIPTANCMCKKGGVKRVKNCPGVSTSEFILVV